jgi:hypothetical protein
VEKGAVKVERRLVLTIPRVCLHVVKGYNLRYQSFLLHKKKIIVDYFQKLKPLKSRCFLGEKIHHKWSDSRIEIL